MYYPIKSIYLSTKGARSVREVRRHLRIHVHEELYRGESVPPKTNLRFFPTKRTIRNHIYKAVVKDRFSKFDQEDIQKKVEQWKKACPEDHFFFFFFHTASFQCTLNDDEEVDEDIIKTHGDGLLFVHQTRYQKHLLQRYGDELSLLDATYKTTKYSLPLFFVAVKTKVDYQVVGHLSRRQK